MDIVSKKKRSIMMAGIRSSNTKPELIIRKALFHKGFRYRIGDKIGKVRPDITLRKYKVAVFVHGCFWHRHDNCELAYVPKSRREFWEAKFRENTLRDSKTNLKLQVSGWRLAVVWECWTRNADKLHITITELSDWILNQNSNWFTNE